MSGALDTIARPYAKAIFVLGHKNGTLEHWRDMLDFLGHVLSHNEIYRRIVSAWLSKQQKIDIILQVCGDKLDDDGKRLVHLLALKKRLLLLPHIAPLFHKLFIMHYNIERVEAYTAFPLTTEEKDEMTTALGAFFSSEVQLLEQKAPQAICGLGIKKGNWVINHSVYHHLNNLAEALNIPHSLH